MVLYLIAINDPCRNRNDCGSNVWKVQPGMVEPSCTPSTVETESGRSPVSLARQLRQLSL